MGGKYFAALSDLLHPPPTHLHGKRLTHFAEGGQSGGFSYGMNIFLHVLPSLSLYHLHQSYSTISPCASPLTPSTSLQQKEQLNIFKHGPCITPHID
jgi:hypothetical protein